MGQAAGRDKMARDLRVFHARADRAGLRANLDAPRQGRMKILLDGPPQPRALYVFAHGAGAGMTHPFMAAVAAGLTERGIATMRYQFPYMEQGSRRPDTPAVAHAT